MLDKVTEIADGWKHLITKDPAREKRAKERAEICASCPKKKKEILLEWIRDEISAIEGYRCTGCGCALSPKLRSKKSKCPLDKWPK